MWGWRGLPASHPCDGARAGAWGHIPALCGSCRWLLGTGEHGLRAPENTSGSVHPRDPSLQGSSRGWGVTGCCPHPFGASQGLSVFVCCGWQL